MAYALNVSSVDRCRFCSDTGWVELAGTVKHHGVVYSRGTAPCKWCEQGKHRYVRAVDLKQHPESNFSESDVVVPDDGRPASRQEALAAIEQMRRQSVGRIAQQGEEQQVKPPQPVAATPELPPEPAPELPSYDPDEIPF